MSRWGPCYTADDIARLQGQALPVGEGKVTNPRQHPEDDLIRQIIQVAHLYGWLAYHPLPARTQKGYRTALQGDPGFPDLILAKARHPLLIIEAKTEIGRVSDAQASWLDALAQAEGKMVFVARPAMWDELVRLLRGR